MNLGYGGPFRPGYPDFTDYDDDISRGLSRVSSFDPAKAEKWARIKSKAVVCLSVILIIIVLGLIFFTSHPILYPTIAVISGALIIAQILEDPWIESSSPSFFYSIALTICFVLIVVLNVLQQKG